MELVSVPQRVDGSPSFKGQAPPTLSTPPNAVGPPTIYGRADSRFVTYQPAPPATAVTTPASNFRNAEERGAGSSRQRMSLLHPPPQPSAEYIMPQVAAPLTPRPDRPTQQPGPPYGGDSGMVKMVPISESPPCKKLRLGTAKPDIHTPLLIDTDRTRSGPAYNPQVEAISPTLPSESLRDESPLRSTKEELLQQIARVDREIAKTESQIAKLKKKKVELEQAATQPQKDTEENSNASDSIIRSLPQCIYTDNRKKALEAHQTLDKLGPKVDLPLYNQPSDTAQYHENKLKYASFKSKLLEYFKTRLKEKERRETYLTTTYAKLSTEWAKRLERMESHAKKRAKEAKNREIFEKVFPELRKQREDKERFSRVGSRIKSDADLEEIMDGLHEQELEDKKMRSYAVIPPILLDERARKRRCNNRNGIMEDPLQEYKDRQVLNLWTEQERDIFKEKYLQHPKNFGIIKSYLERKNVSDCVQYYYLSKKTQNYRQLLRKNRQRTRSTRNQQQNSAASANSAGGNPAAGLPVVKNEPNGVTTRQQKEQKSDQQTTSNSGVGASNTNLLPIVNLDTTNTEVGENSNFSGATADDAMNIETGMTAVAQPPHSDYSGQPKKKRKEDTKENIDMDTSDEENMELNGEKGGPHNCSVCKTSLETFLLSRPLVRSQATQYGLNEEDIHPGDRVCTSCRCKAVRRRYKPNCPIPTCPARRARIKRLRPFPPKWAELSEEIREAICAKYQIPPNVTKCCTACFNRISRRLNPNTSLDTPDDPGSDTTRWTDEEIDTFKKALVELGTDWCKLSERISTKSDLQCRNFYFNFRKKHGLDALVQEFKKSKGGDGPPTLTDEEESGSTTSSCDESVNPPQDQSRGSVDKKDDYDSSATVSAEEGGPTESEKPHSVEDINRGHPDAPLQLTMRPNHSIIQQTPPIQAQHISQSQSPHHGGPPQSHLHPNLPSGLVITTQAGHHSMGQTHSSSALSLHHGPSPHNQPPHHGHATLHATGPHLSQSSAQGPRQGSHPSLHAQGMSSHLHIQQQPQHLNSSSHHHSVHQGRYSSPENNDVHEPMTVEDLMLKTIERQLGRNTVTTAPQNTIPNQSQMHPGPSLSPTITSILKSQDRSHLPPPGQHMLIAQPPRNLPASSPQQQQQPPNLPVSSPHYQQPHPVFYPGANKVDMRGISSHHITRADGHPMIQNPQPPPEIRDDCITLDLSMKKRPASPPTQQRSSNAGPPPAHQPLDFTPSRQEDYYQKFSPMNRARAVQLAPPPPKASKVVPPPPPLLTKPPVLSPMKDGSITHGTPMALHHPQARFPEPGVNFQHNVHNRNSNIRGYPPPQPAMQTKYEGLLRPSKEGSITQGTPVTVDKGRGKDVSQPYMYDRPEYYKRMSPAAPYYHGSSSPYYGQRPPSTGQQRSSPPSAQSSPYAIDQHNSSRQVIMNDFYTSQQMQQPPPTHQPQQSPQNSVQQISRVDPIKRNVTPVSVTPATVYVLPSRHEGPYRQSPTPPTSHAAHQQQRQGVIHRANPQRSVIKTEPNRYQHEAFASLVDVAAAQPSLPVPKDEHRSRVVGLPRVDMVVREGLGKSLGDMEKNRMTSTQAHQSQQMYRPPPGPPSHSMSLDMQRNRKDVIESNKGYNRGASDATDNTLTAASLIDAIITHQINQSSPHDRLSPAPPPRGDRLFASFQRSQSNVSQQLTSQGPPSSGSNFNASSHHEDLKSEDGRGVDYKNPQGGTWGDHIDLIISKDYASGKGSASGQGVGGPQQQSSAGSASVPVSLAQSPHHQPMNQQPKLEEEMGPYISWKLRRALQHQEQQQQQQQQMHQNHPDERHIIRVVQPEAQHPRPPSVPTSKEMNYPPVSEDGSDNLSMMISSGSTGMPSGAPPGPGDLYPRRTTSQPQGISPLDYVKNRIVEVMRTENTDEKSEESSNACSNDANISNAGPPTSSAGSTATGSVASKGLAVTGNTGHSRSTASPSGSAAGSHTLMPKDSSGGTNDNSRVENSQGGNDHRSDAPGVNEGER
ncbi:unnamed protein product [Allacma fusca]|uniref:Nuclear receptor corepressor 1 n=1 Tax=Allacma fusca TaxID=39272 RepID=A0A8J2LBN4_9HEXA|nr:unnamed protein product [Allacma fusca]